LKRLEVPLQPFTATFLDPGGVLRDRRISGDRLGGNQEGQADDECVSHRGELRAEIRERESRVGDGIVYLRYREHIPEAITWIARSRPQQIWFH
jgi:hypothetical protein